MLRRLLVKRDHRQTNKVFNYMNSLKAHNFEVNHACLSFHFSDDLSFFLPFFLSLHYFFLKATTLSISIAHLSFLNSSRRLSISLSFYSNYFSFCLFFLVSRTFVEHTLVHVFDLCCLNYIIVTDFI